jgi:phage terminase large subunit-like protein
MQPVTHGHQKKTERILWALQGRFQRGRIALLKGQWNDKFIEQLLDFPNPLSHDDLIDAVAYIDQISQTAYLPDDYYEDEWEPLDDWSGF